MYCKSMDDKADKDGKWGWWKSGISSMLWSVMHWPWSANARNAGTGNYTCDIAYEPGMTD
ncbi:hypothetical protein KDK_10300 [Dictyobacter kobayashii]|uniref:Uncharacterized protein n=1 Tax=Dictyobacter kobayashii TaxID=2014872 RepID=A0A402ADP6_9CHLR|nr:hypothetical protein KDK_10300 [Dictyobacter kobayashii]